jgi:hypothetical protein
MPEQLQLKTRGPGAAYGAGKDGIACGTGTTAVLTGAGNWAGGLGGSGGTTSALGAGNCAHPTLSPNSKINCSASTTRNFSADGTARALRRFRGEKSWRSDIAVDSPVRPAGGPIRFVLKSANTRVIDEGW